MTGPTDIEKAVLAERERIAAWHDRQAEALDRAMQRIAEEGGMVVSPRSLAELHRSFAKAIREGAE
ncbi:MAG: hypothetical protein JWM16_6315 [Verrucomicrobiales bacterium]|nr:hypothetical protein [Verrucomicrobiales bacterium]